MKPLETRSEDDQARTLEWMYRIFSGSAIRKSQTEAKSDAPLIPDAAEARETESDTAPSSDRGMHT